MSKLCTTLLSRIRGAFTIIPVRPERSGAKSKDAISVLATLLMVAALAGCGGGGGGKTAALPTPVPIEELSQGIMLQPGDTLTIPAGQSRTVGQTDGVRDVASCPEGGEDCVLSVGADGVLQYTGSKPTIAPVSYTTIQLPDDHELMAGTIPAGEFRQVHQTFDTRTVVTCPADGDDCEVTAVTGNGAESTGGALTVTTYTTLYLPSGHTLNEGTIPAGVSRPIGGYSKGRSYDIVCPFDGEDCVVTLGEYDFESTGGAPTVVAKYNRMVWQANNGPAGTSDGAHARGLDRPLGQGNAVDVGLNLMFERSTHGYAARHGAISAHSRTVVTDPRRTVTPTASWASSAAAPTLGLTVSGTGSDTFSVDGDSNVPSLGTGWNGAILSKTFSAGTPPTGRTAYAVVHSNIQKASGATPDPYYQTLGAWVLFPDDPAAGSDQYHLGVFADAASANALSGANVIALGGTATFRGPATGLYTEAAWSGSGGSRAPDTAKVGSFTATATINANFGSTGSFTGLGFRGNVTNFMENGESLGNWTVNLNRMAGREAGNLDLWNRGDGEARGSGDGRSFTEGYWAVQFYRNSASGHPDSAVGTFHTSTDDLDNNALRIFGAFSAERQ